uniref:Choline transporter-like protein n=1 Tax=Odontella aurita TaxID=265563 RepID=A0A7S4K077_9STRA|mmetsp:Transcript_576/g.1781  ORF Transcript_576/g.1781 Transcript_576/m.1781 type:complete len:210 (+) Transcript_576:1173-1802(+)
MGQDSFIRATTYSFGSICFGSLLVALIQALRSLQHALRDNEDFNFLVCIVDCILGCMEAIIEYLNKWAYIYVGLYGYSYLEAGKNVITLFQNKGWSAIITDNLIDNVLLMMSVAIGLLTGLIGLLLAVLDNNLFAGIGIDDGGSVGFFVGFLVGYVLASILMSVVGSAVNTVIVCFAEAPAEFQQNHPQLSDEMRFAWTQAWPVECGSL